METDYLIIGAGTAGCVLADRLSADGASKVLLLEAGGSDRRLMVRIPAGFYHLLRTPAVGWGYETAPEPGLDGRRVPYPRGRIVGGCSSINGLWQSRGLPSDYGAWAEAAGDEWGYSAMLPYFQRSEAYRPGGTTRGTSGKIRVEPSEIHPLTRQFFAAGRRLQLPWIEDYNDTPGEGLAPVQQTRRGRLRHSAADAYLRGALRRGNLQLVSNALVTRIAFDGSRAIGAHVSIAGQEPVLIRARREVILAAGAINSPHLLHLSGIGPAEELRRVGITTVLDLPAVGENLHDHYNARVAGRLTRGSSLNQDSRFPRLVPHLFRYALRGRGILTYSAANGTGFVKSSPDEPEPDLQLVFTPASYSPEGGGKLDSFAAVSCGVWLMRPQSRGRLRTVSADPRAKPSFHLGFLQSDSDRRRMLVGMQWARRLLAEAFGDEIAEVRPGPEVQDEAALLRYMQQTGATVFHPVGSCRMGRDEAAVVDPRLQVNGIAGLRVVDASVIPTIPSSNTHAPVVALAEKAADLILGNPPAPPATAIRTTRELSRHDQ
ncbi:GMC family oxidoreductase [Paracoccus sp. S-4012]|uniref:GMC family oxidoreductase n=1 Tax=Paracoccus sp. S-4012 TaxID=2665648 RepID=UPI001E48D980|nr:GMC family oxidoreductase N-terminal domain-containing protein [Paracoccus sp. S-4012]